MYDMFVILPKIVAMLSIDPPMLEIKVSELKNVLLCYYIIHTRPTSVFHVYIASK